MIKTKPFYFSSMNFINILKIPHSINVKASLSKERSFLT
ncbi:hypothetical protein HPCPY6311_0984 [Helicobacter pylori CPY6311]|nr:hypothetical protein HPCPY6311_0984 [Helicobacter pylori CPY6311]